MQAHSEYNLKLYFTIAYSATLLLWLTGAYVSFRHPSGALRPGLYNAVMFSGLSAPFVVSVSMILASRDRELLRSYLRRMVNPKLIQPGTAAVFLLFMPMVILASVLISILLGEPVTQFELAEHPAGGGGLAPFAITLMLAATVEELGWRGYAFEGLETRYGFFRASIILGMLWSVWLLPLLLVTGSHPHGLMLQSPWLAVNFYLGIVPISFLISWVYVKNGNSLIAAVLFHGALIICGEALSLTPLARVIQNVVMAVVATGVVLTDRELFFHTEHSRQAKMPLSRRSI